MWCFYVEKWKQLNPCSMSKPAIWLIGCVVKVNTIYVKNTV